MKLQHVKYFGNLSKLQFDWTSWNLKPVLSRVSLYYLTKEV